ncbi:insulinase family protein [Kordiimonas sp. 5E331]|nr:insulinase family protein [Kordiimonas laminariae]
MKQLMNVLNASTMLKSATIAAGIFTLAACGDAQTSSQNKTPAGAETAADVKSDTLVAYETFTLDNGLKTILHIDRSDPVVAVALTAHVGSAREKEGRTGFAHLFEHLLFLESENLGKGGLDQMSARIGGSGANGSTSRDRTNYFQTVPKDALEKMIWAEADKLGWFINTVTDPVLAKEKQVVKNEKRQSVDNRPYGHSQYVTDKALYPEGHPYNWQVIGSLEDLDAATLEDVKEFFRRWYVPNNVTLTISGDFDVEQAKEWVEKYFGEIPRGEDVAKQPRQAGVLPETKSYYWEDNFARLPQLTMTWPTVPVYDADSYPLAVLNSLLTEGKDAPLNKVLIDDKKLTSTLFMFPYESEVAGQMTLGVRANPGTKLDDVKTAIDEAFAKFEADGIKDADLNRIKTQAEVDFYSGIQSVLGKGFQLAQYDVYLGDPGYIDTDLARIKGVTKEDVMRVYGKYIKGQPFVATSFVPKGQKELALAGAELANVVEEKIVQGAEQAVDPNVVATYEKTPSSFDRSVEPPYGETPVVKAPTLWEAGMDNGLKVYGIEDREIPVVQFDLTIEGGQLLDTFEKTGTANLVAEMMNKGTANRTTAELEKALQSLGASVNITAGSESIRLRGETLSRNFDAVMTIVAEMMLEPRWDAEEFDLAKLRIDSQLTQAKSNPNAIAAEEFGKIVYGENNILSRNIMGSADTLANITLDDLKAFYAANISPSVAKLHVVGAVTDAEVKAAAARLGTDWAAKEVSIPSYAMAADPSESKVYFYNVPGAKQSVLRFGYSGPKAGDTELYPATVMNYILGGGGFASRLTQELREGKGYTYGIRSGFQGSKTNGFFQIGSGVRSNVTLEATDLVKDILTNYGSTFTDEDLGVTKSFLSKSQTRAFETQGAKLGMLRSISVFGLPSDYAQQRANYLEGVTVDDIQKLATDYIRPQAMHYVIVGDASTQMERLKELGFGDPVLLNPTSE